MDFHFFDRELEVPVTERRLPHWQQPGCLCFITLRAADSIPRDVVNRWRVERAQWLRHHGIEPTDMNWREKVKELTKSLQRLYHENFTSRWLDELDRCHGECLLRNPKFSKLVAN